MIRKAILSDIYRVAQIYEAIHEQEESGHYIIGWKSGVYPTEDTAQAALERDDLYVAEYNGEIYASAIINHIQLPEYDNIRWSIQASDDEVLVLHTLVVDPCSPIKGTGTEFVSFYEEMAKQRKCKSLRMDTQTKNLNARTFYAKLGFREAGVVKCDFCGCGIVDLVLLEKIL